jgi:DNA-directed RNA polymerase specialized sigma24 family protein
MVVVKTVEEFQRENENELKSFLSHKTGIIDQEIINDTIQDFYLRLMQTKALEGFDETRAPTDEQNMLNYERWVCNNFCWFLPLMRKKNYTQVLKLKVLSEKERRKREDYIRKYGEEFIDEEDPSYETLRFYSEISVKKPQSTESVSIYDVVNPASKNNPYKINPDYDASIVEQDDEDVLVKSLNAFFRHVQKVLPEKKARQIILYMKYRKEGLNNVDIAIILGVSNNMVKFIKRDARAMYKKWTKELVIA